MKILQIEDEQSLRESIELYLKAEEFRIQSAMQFPSPSSEMFLRFRKNT